MNNIYWQLDEMTVGCTKIICGLAVTRWAKDSFEIGTWGKSSMSLSNAEAKLINND